MAPVRPFARTAQIDGVSLYSRIQLISRSGTTRLAYSEEDVRARAVVMEMMQNVGLSVSIDAAGNIVGRRAGREQRPPLAFGSHVDTVRNGGLFDGILGVMAAIECVGALQKTGYTTAHPLELIVFANEEGQRFGALCGSRALVGSLRADELARVDESGRTLAEAIQSVGGDPAQLPGAARQSGELAAFVELHIEQGGTLERAGVPIGIVEGISGISYTEVRVIGAANHSGTTAMELRRDALIAAAELVLCVQRAALEKRCHVATVGQLIVSPNATNIIPGEVAFTIEIRDLDREKILASIKHIRECGDQIASRSNIEIEFSDRKLIDSVPCSPVVREAIVRSCADLGLKFQTLPSGAGHDAQMMAQLGPTGMIFVPSVGGISHSPREFTTSEDCARGTQVLLETMLHLDNTLASFAESE
jgi:beta-ureidopropionase / N-carbamoyl-L-amino-acid hydrolase